MPDTLHLISETHWDREWYQTFQQFRLRLVHLVDRLLAILESNPDYRYYMLDGQTIVLEDYLAMRPEKEELLRGYISSGRVLVGPWYILPDEFLVSPEAIVRNLLVGRDLSRRFGGGMPVGYIPDPFGHIGQMPQILQGFGIQMAAFRRGLADEPCEVWWQAPDGSRVLSAYLRDGYDNAAWVNTASPSGFPDEMAKLAASLRPHTQSAHLLMMQGSDHIEPTTETTDCITYTNNNSSALQVEHSTLPLYLAEIQKEVEAGLYTPPTVSGELRNPKKHHLLPGVLSARTWIKQRNHACENLLERWAEPFSAWAGLLTKPDLLHAPHLSATAPLVRQAWKLLLQNHPHDSICGCSIDQVHDEMRPRFDQVDQIGEELTRQALEVVASQVDTNKDGTVGAVTVFNASGFTQSGPVRASLFLPAGLTSLQLVDADFRAQPCLLEPGVSEELASFDFDAESMRGALGMLQSGEVMGMGLVECGFRREGDTMRVELVLAPETKPDFNAMVGWNRQILAYCDDATIRTFAVRARKPQSISLQWLAEDVPACGLKTYWLIAAESATPNLPAGKADEIDNGYLRAAVEADGTLTLHDLITGRTLRGLNRLVDGGDAGDEYNVSPPAQDSFITQRLVSVEKEIDALRQTLIVNLMLDLPAGLSADRQSRSSELAACPVTVRATLWNRGKRLEIETAVDNRAEDHRLRAHFPLAGADAGYTAGHYQVHGRLLTSPLPYMDGWVEQPRPELPQRVTSTLMDENGNMTVAAPGLYEVELAKTAEGGELVLTLLRCVGWLSRPDLSTRSGGAGPTMPTPGSQEHGIQRFKYAIIPHPGDWHSAAGQAEGFDLPLRAANTGLHGGSLPLKCSLVQTSGLIVTAVKASEDGHGLAVRGWASAAGHVSIHPWKRFSYACQARIDETPLDDLQVEPDGSVTLDARENEVVTVVVSG